MKKLMFLNLLISINLFSISYKTIETQATRVIFEEDLEEQAKTVAGNIDKLKPIYEGEHKERLKQIPLVLRKDSAQSNAYFHPLLQKMEFIMSPMLDDSVGTTPWLTTLSIHEYRHYNQNKMAADNPVSKLYYVLGGENFRTLIDIVNVPRWFKEGDAIYYETKFSNNGRGRTPSFLKEYRALLDEDKNFTFAKAKNGSYKDYVPNHYYLGYVLVSYGYEKYGDKFWEEVINLTVNPKKYKNYKKFQHTLSYALKAKTGLYLEEFYEEALKYYEEKFKEEKTIEYVSVNKEALVPTNYTYPYDTKNEILSLKNSSNQWTALYSIKNGQEKKIIDFGNIAYGYYSLRGNKVIWVEIEPDLINAKKNSSNIKIYDLETRKKENLTKKSSYFFPSISRKGQFIAVIENKGTETTKIHILDNKGRFIKELPNDKKYQYNSIDWSEDDKNLIVSLRDKDGKMGLISVNIDNFEEKEFIPFDYYIIGSINVHEDNVYFTGSFDITENVYRFSIKENKLYKLTSSNIGTFGGRIIDGELYFSEYSANGYNLKKTKNTEGIEIEPKSLLESEELNTENFKNTDLNLVKNVEKNEYPVKNYSNFMHLIKPYAWIIANEGDDFVIEVMSSNELEDFNSSIKYKSSYETEFETINLSGEFTRYWPNISIEYENELGAKNNGEKIGLGLSFPMNFSKNEYLRATDLKLTYDDYFNKDKSQYSIDFGIANSKYPAKKDIVTAGSQKGNISYTSDLDNSKLATSLALTTKAFSENDGFKYEFTYEKDKGDLGYIKDEVISRGYSEKIYDKAIKNSLDYYIPLGYPDFGKAGFYFNRVKTNLFYDNTQLNDRDTYSTIGNKLSVEGRIADLIDFETSVQYNYLLEDKDYKIDWGFQIEF